MILRRITLAVSLVCFWWLAAAREAPATCDPDGQQADGAVYRICMPDGEWNGALVIYAHGYVSFNEPIAIPEGQVNVPGLGSLADIVTDFGFAFATTSYRVNGLAVREALDDIVDLVDIFVDQYGKPDHIYLGGASEGGLVTALLIEQHPEIFDGGISVCGPIGYFPWQISYWGNFRIVFEYFFPGLIPSTAVLVPQEVIDNWNAVYKPLVLDAIRADPDATAQFLKVAGASWDPDDFSTAEETVLGLLRYHVFATNDGVAKLGGQPLENRWTHYHGSDDDRDLNWSVPRYAADRVARISMRKYFRTTGALSRPLVTMHTTGDPIVPYWHNWLYGLKAWLSGGRRQLVHIPVPRYGHCAFTETEVIAGLAILLFRTHPAYLIDVLNVLNGPEEVAEYNRIIDKVVPGAGPPLRAPE